jgi:hypothetical protein
MVQSETSVRMHGKGNESVSVSNSPPILPTFLLIGCGDGAITYGLSLGLKIERAKSALRRKSPGIDYDFDQGAVQLDQKGQGVLIRRLCALHCMVESGNLCRLG